LERGGGFEFEDAIVGGVVPKNYIPAVEKGVVEAMLRGVMAGYPVVDMKVKLYDGSYHPVDSSDMSFKIAASMGFQKAAAEADMYLLEPVMDVDVIAPDESMGDIIGDLNGRRGRIVGVEPSGHVQKVKARVPLQEMFTYSSTLRSLTSGRGTYTMRFSSYEEVPGDVSKRIVAAYAAKAEG
jgi:elongation factor G